jgi:hypothetical protein
MTTTTTIGHTTIAASWLTEYRATGASYEISEDTYLALRALAEDEGWRVGYDELRHAYEMVSSRGDYGGDDERLVEIARIAGPHHDDIG